MATSDDEFGEAVVREVVRTVGYWVAGLTGLFLFFHLAPGDPVELILGQQASPAQMDQIRARLGLDRPLPLQWIDWLVSATLLDYGQSFGVARGVPVRELIFDRVIGSLRVLVGGAVIGLVLAVPGFVAVERTRESDADLAVVALAALASAVAPLLVVVTFIWVGVTLGVLPVRWPDGDGVLAEQLLATVALGLALAIPLVGLATRRYRTTLSRVRVDGPGPAVRSLLASGERGYWAVDFWLMAAYTAGALVLVETVFVVPGLGELLIVAVYRLDVTLVLGIVAFAFQVAVVLRLLAAVGLAAVADSLVAGGEEAVPEDRSGLADGGLADPVVHDPEALLRSAMDRDTTRLGAAGVLFVGLSALLGPLVISPKELFGTKLLGFAPGHVVDSLGTVVVAVLVASVLATLLGASFGVLAGREGRPVSSVLRVPADLFLLVPLQVPAILWWTFVGTPTDRLGAELLVGHVGGLVLAGYAFHVARHAADRRFRAAPDADLGGPGGVALLAAVGRTLGVAPLVVFLAAELAFLGLLDPPGTLSAVVGLDRSLSYLGSGDPATVLGSIVTAAVPIAVPAASLALVGDGIVDAVTEREADASTAGGRADERPVDEDRAEDGQAGGAGDGVATAESTETDETPTVDDAASVDETTAETAVASPAAGADEPPPVDEEGAADAVTGTDDPAVDRPGPPTEVPRAPSLSVAYDDVERVERIGSGGSADVHLARVDGQEIALKEPRFDDTMHREAVERFLEEAETWAKLDDHDNVVGVIDWGADPIPWLALEYMDGGHLGTLAGEMPLDRALWTALSTVRGVHNAHRRGVAHLDLKPANVLLRTVEGAWDVPKVADWGLAKLMLDHSHSVEGFSPQYAAPEQFDPDAYGRTDQVTDVYQLGAVCYELFTGETPFEGQSARVMHAVLNDDPLPPSELDPSLPRSLDDVLLGALAKEKADRYESVLYLRDDLEAIYEEHRDR